jgi:hypothetical protein
MAEGRITTDHEEIRRWAEERDGQPAAVRRTYSGDDPGIIRIAFPDAPYARDEALQPISWDEFFEKFDEAELAMVYQEETADGRKSNFNKLIGRDTAEAREHADRTHTSHQR